MLRTDLFKTVSRVETRFIAIRDTRTKPKDIAETNAQTLDALHCKQGRFGIGYHFLILSGGTIQLCRDIQTCGSHTQHKDDISVAVGVVGGVDDEGTKALTRDEEQQSSLSDLIEILVMLYPQAVLDDAPLGITPLP